ncbi:MAG: hypothetical protein IRZ05_19930 [Micromonosporaceae bacterium]|nr:hypothetical protein [Micromonosporaceae bacterium]
MSQTPPPEPPAPDQTDQPPRRRERLPVSEIAFDRPGGPSPFGDDLAVPLPVERLRYQHE